MAPRRPSSFGTGERTRDVEIECVFQFYHGQNDSICIRNGETGPNGLGKEVPKEFWVSCQHISDSTYDHPSEPTRGDKIGIFIPEWYATKLGLV